MDDSHQPVSSEHGQRGRTAEAAQPQCPVFSPQQARRQFAIDSVGRGFFWIALSVGVTWMMLTTGSQTPGSGSLPIVFLICAGAWVIYNVVIARVARELPRISELIEADPAQAEALIATSLRRRPLQRSLRLLLYHRLAILRRHQDRFAEAAAICQTVLSYPLRGARAVRGQLLLILAESSLRSGSLWGTWQALGQLRDCRLNLLESLQMVAIQTRYEVESGYDAAALHGLDRKITMAELMPAAQCGAMHAILATAAQRSQQVQVADWLRRRAELLCTPQQLAMLWASGDPLH